jgi:hypothetical protein
MPFQVSPGVNVTEVDLTTVVPAVATSVGAFVGHFAWGPAEEITLVSSENELASYFGKPNNNTAVDFMSAANFLAYSNALQVVRVANTTGSLNAAETGASPGSDNQLIKNDRTFESSIPTANTFYARHFGSMGNELTVEVCDTDDADVGLGFSNWWPNTYFSGAPGTSTWATNLGASKDELHVAIIDSNTGAFSGTANSVLEIFPFLSKAKNGLDDNGNANYFYDVINNKSQYIRVGTGTNILEGTYGSGAVNGTTFGNTASGIVSSRLRGGEDGASASGEMGADEYTRGYDLLADPDSVDIGLIVTGQGGKVSATDHYTVQKYAHDNVAKKRLDCVAFISPRKEDTVDQSTDASRLTEVLKFRNTHVNINSSYAFLDSGWKYQYDKYNDTYRWVPLNGDIAGLAARTENQRDAWWSPAGYNRGQVKNVVKVAYNPSKAHRDQLYQKQVNPVVTFPGQGTLLFGDKTMQTRPSAFDRLNVRRLFIVLEKAISTAAKFSLFEFNDEFTRAQFRNMVEPFLRDVKGRRGITDFKVVCDETNNPGSVVDRNEFVGDIYVKPARSINFIQLNFVAVATGVDFSEVVGKF